LFEKADEGLAAFAAAKDAWSCAILDVMMPVPEGWDDDQGDGMTTGLTLGKRIRKLRPDIPIVFLTGSHDAQVLHEVMQFPSSKYLDRRATKRDKFVGEVKRMAAKSTKTAPPETA